MNHANLKFSLVATLAALVTAAQGATSEPLIPDGWYLSLSHSVDGAPAVCPPGKSSAGDFNANCKDAAAKISPQKFVELACPGARLVTLQPFYKNKLFVPHFLMGYQKPPGVSCPAYKE